MPNAVAAQLRQLPLFATLSRRALAVADSLVTPVQFPAGRPLCVEGEVGREAFVLVSGTATVSQHGVAVAEVGAGAVVGELALLGDGYRNATVTATTDVVALVMNAREFNSLLILPGVADAIAAAQRTRRAVA